MPLIQSPSKKAFKKNVETEMKEHPDKKAQDLAIAYSMKRKSSKKMAKGGEVPHEPINQNDKDELADNHEMKPMSKKDIWTDKSSADKASNRPKIEPIKHPRSVPSSAFSTKMYNKEGHLIEDEAPASPKEEPEHDYNELEAKKHGTAPHKMKMMAKGGQMDDKESSKINYVSRPDTGYGAVIMKAEGGEIEHQQPEDEAMEEHAASIAAAIMAKFKKMKDSSGASDEPIGMFAEGGEADLDMNAMEEPNEYDHRNEEILKENYDEDMDDMHQPEDSNEHSPEHEPMDKHDMVSAIRKKMKSRKQF